MASGGSYIVQSETGATDKYILKAPAFNDWYVHEKDNYYVPTEKARVFALQLTPENIINYKLTAFERLIREPHKGLFIESPRKENQEVALNDYLVCVPFKNEMYRIALAEFDGTYKRLRPGS